jgi:hypothetical protein
MSGFPFFLDECGTDALPSLPQHFCPYRVLAARLPKREHFNAARESLLGMRQTDKCRERDMFMVRRAEEVVLSQPRGDIESRIAFHGRAGCPASGRRRILAWLHGAPQFGGFILAPCGPSPFLTGLDGSNVANQKIGT